MRRVARVLLYPSPSKGTEAKEREITATTKTAHGTKTTATATAEQVLRDVAYVLKLTRRVKEEMMAEQPAAQVAASRTAEGVLVA